MFKATLPLMACAVTLAGCAVPPEADPYGTYQVQGVEAGDMLKLRAGPGTEYRILAGLPNGSVVHAHGCQQEGSVRWCNVSVDGARAMDGYVSASYLRPSG